MPKNGLDSTKQKKRNDVILILILLVIAGGCLLFVRMNKKSGAYVTITVDGIVMEECSLKENQIKKIQTDEFYNKVTIQDGKVTMEEADCPDKICVNHKAISKVGETIVCLPHRVVVTITDKQSNENQKEFDAISK